MSATNYPKQPAAAHHVIFTIPRTASHLFVQLLNLPAQPSVLRRETGIDGYFFLDALLHRFNNHLAGKPVAEWTAEEEKGLKNAFQKGLETWLALMREAELSNKRSFTKEHINWLVDPVAAGKRSAVEKPRHFETFRASWPEGFGYAHTDGTLFSPENPLVVPDEFLLKMVKPTFLIRHPALAFPSIMRATDVNEILNSEKVHKWECTYQWSLAIYNFYVQHTEIDRKTCVEGVDYPIIIDAQDLSNETLIKKYAKAVGLDEEKVRYDWEPATTEDIEKVPAIERRLKMTILTSTGVQKGRLGGEGEVDVEKLREGWHSEFGQAVSERLEQLVKDNMGMYEELKSKRLRV